MAYVGNTPTTQSFIAGTDYFNGDGSTVAFTLSRSVNSVNDIEAVINNVVQQPNTAYTISGTTITFTSAPSAGTSNIYVRYLSTTTQSITPSQNTVSYSTLNSDNQSKLGISFKNRIINGAMVIDQRNAGASVTPSDQQLTLDRWKFRLGASSKLSTQQSSTAPTGFVNSLLVTSLSSYSAGASEQFYINQRIEGYNVADLGWGTANAKTVTLSFWVQSSLTGTFGGAVLNQDANRSYPFTYTISSANTFEYKTVTIPGDITGTWVTGNGIGISLTFNLGSGSSLQSAPGVWASGFYPAPTGSTSVVGTNGATFYITGVQLEAGTQATTFDYRSYTTELQLCQRYCTVYGGDAQYTTIGQGVAISATSAYCIGSFPTQMRTQPSFSYSGNWRTEDMAIASYTVTGLVVNTNFTGNKTFTLQNTVASGLTTLRMYATQPNNDINAKAIFSAEL